MEEKLDFVVHDKWQEAIYQAKKMLKSFKDYQNNFSDNQSQFLQEFRYDFNAFVNASRSVTFILQKVYNKIPEFENWYKEKQEILKNDEFAKKVLDLRNLNQKQGNTYPMIQLNFSENNKIESSLIFSGVPIRYDEKFADSFILNSSSKILPDYKTIYRAEIKEGETHEEVFEKYKDDVIKMYIENEIELRKQIEKEGRNLKILSRKIFLSNDFMTLSR